MQNVKNMQNVENMQKVADEIGLTHYLFDETQEVAKAYGATCTPDPFVFDTSHKLVYHCRINDAMNPDFDDETAVNPFDLWEGANFKLRARQLEGFRNYDKSEFSAK